MQKAVKFTIPARYYSRGSVDGASGTLAKGYNGEKTKQITLSTANTAIAAMHVSSNTFIAEPDVKAYWDDWSTRSNAVTRDHIAPLFGAARSIGLHILYICAGWSARNNYPQYREIAARVETPPPTPPPGQRVSVPAWKQTFMDESLGRGCRVPGAGSDIAPIVAAQPEDWIVARTAEASTLFHEHGIWNILFVGFDTSGCILTSPGGVLPMRSLGYRCFIVEDCTESCETPATRAGKELKKTVLQCMEFGGYSYTVNGSDIIESMEKARKVRK